MRPGREKLHTLAVPRRAALGLALLALIGCAGPFPAAVPPAASPISASTPPASLPPTAPGPTTLAPAAATLAPDASPPAPFAQAATPTPTGTAEPALEICSPLDIHPLAELPEIVSDPYHPPPPGKEERHHGVDFSYYRRGERLSIEGVGVQAALAGRAAMALAGSFPYGNVVILETPAEELPVSLVGRLGIGPGESLYLLYAHMGAAPLVASGEEVAACQALGTVGKSGNAGVAHLHLETRIGPAGAVFPSMQFYIAGTTQEERDLYLLWRTSGTFRHFDPMDLLSK